MNESHIVFRWGMILALAAWNLAFNWQVGLLQITSDYNSIGHAQHRVSMSESCNVDDFSHLFTMESLVDSQCRHKT